MLRRWGLRRGIAATRHQWALWAPRAGAAIHGCLRVELRIRLSLRGTTPIVWFFRHSDCATVSAKAGGYFLLLLLLLLQVLLLLLLLLLLSLLLLFLLQVLLLLGGQGECGQCLQ